MLKIFKKDICNPGRQYNLDLLKSLSIICMIVCHTVIEFVFHYRTGYESEILYIIADDIIGNYFGVAHAFMFCMGIGLVYSRRKSSLYLFKRGVFLYILGYVLNFCREGIPYLIISVITPEQGLENFISALYCQDILHFAGLALILTAILKKLNCKVNVIVLIAFIMSILGSLLAYCFDSNVFMNIIVGSFVPTTVSCFSLFNWYIFVALGILFGTILKRIGNLDKFYRYILIVSFIVMFVYIVLTCINGMFFLCKDNIYYCVGTLEVFGLLSIDFFLMSVFYFLIKKISAVKFKYFIEMSKDITSVYFISWCIICYSIFIIYELLGFELGYLFLYLYSIPVIISSCFLAKKWRHRQILRFNFLRL